MISYHINKIADRNKKCFALLLVDAYSVSGKGSYRLALHCLLCGKTVVGYVNLASVTGLVHILIEVGNSLLHSIKAFYHAMAYGKCSGWVA